MYAVADMGGTAWKLALIEDGAVLTMTEIPNTRQESDLDGLRPAFDGLCQKIGARLDQCRALGLSMPEMVDVETGYIRPPLDKHKYLDGRAIQVIGDRLDLKAFADNDARAALLGEYHRGAGRDHHGRTVLLVTFGTGIGVAAMIKGQILRGDNAAGGMLGGHISVDLNGARCYCGNIGCAETLASGWGVAETVPTIPGFENSALDAGKPVTFAAICDALRAGDDFAQSAMDHCVKVWSTMLVTQIHLLDPSLLILSGGFMRSADLFAEDLAARTRTHLWRPENMPQMRIARDPMLSALRGAEIIASEGLTAETPST